MSQNYFYHNGMFLSEDELMHFKYISKKKVNGKWRYVYDQSELDKEGANAKKQVLNAHGKAAAAYRNQGYYYITDDYGTTKELQNTKAYKDTEKMLKEQKHNRSALDVIKESKEDLKRARRAETKYNLKKISSAPARAISKAIAKVGNILLDAKAKSSKKKKKKK